MAFVLCFSSIPACAKQWASSGQCWFKELGASSSIQLLDRVRVAHKFLRMSTLHFMMLWKEVSWIPLASLPVKFGWNTIHRTDAFS